MLTTEKKANDPNVANLVKAGDGQEKAEAITDFVFMAHDMSNAYLVTTNDGDVLINAGFMGSEERLPRLFAPHRTGPLRRIILTQHHTDHFGCLPQFLEDGSEVIVQADFMANKADTEGLSGHFPPRVRKLWGAVIDMDRMPTPPDVNPDIIVDRDYSFEQGGRRFEIISTPGGEATDCLTVWMPNEKIAFVGNVFGPVFMSMPFLNTLRGDKPRLVRSYLRSLEIIRDLNAEILITGHGAPIVGADKVRADLDRMHAAVSWVRDYTLAGMNAGKDIHSLMREIEVPDDIRIDEYHGKSSWAVRSIWHEYSGWFFYDSTTSLYGVPRSSIDNDLAELAGGADKLAQRAEAKIAAGQLLEAIHLLDIALGADARNAAALNAKKSALTQLLAQTGGQNLSEAMWLRSEIASTEAALA